MTAAVRSHPKIRALRACSCFFLPGSKECLLSVFQFIIYISADHTCLKTQTDTQHPLLPLAENPGQAPGPGFQ